MVGQIRAYVLAAPRANAGGDSWTERRSPEPRRAAPRRAVRRDDDEEEEEEGDDVGERLPEQHPSPSTGVML